MFYSIRDKLKRIRLSRTMDQVFKTQPVQTEANSTLAVLSLVQKKDIAMYLVAVKSFLKGVGKATVYCLNDGSLDQDSKSLIATHVIGINFLELENFVHADLPKGGCWERLVAISTLLKRHYVVQLDCDTLTLHSIPEIRELVMKNQSFYIRTEKNTELLSAVSQSEQSSKVFASGERHVQIYAESTLVTLEHSETIKYARACAGFSGFSKGEDFLPQVISWAKQLNEALGAQKWGEWGSEQFMSNLVISNRDTANLLPYPDYAHCDYIDLKLTRFIHFIGFCRYNNGTYAKLSEKIITQL